LLTRFQTARRSQHNCKFTDFLIGTIIILVLGSVAFDNVFISNAGAQAPPLLPPPSSFSSPSNSNHNLRIAPNDTNPPKVEILSKDFTEGNNRVFVIVTDESDLRSLEVRYVNNGDIVSSDLIKDQGDQYFGLVKVEPPSCVLDFEITDAANNTASIAKEFKVSPQGNIFDQLWAWFKGFLSNFGLS
jgi:hypothetical protein